MKTVLITGGSSGIGAATARLVSAQGWSVFIGFRSGEERAVRLVNEIKAKGGQAWPVAIDLTDLKSIDHAVEQIAAFSSTLQAVVLSASPAPLMMSFLKTGPQTLLEHFQANVIGNHYLITQMWKRFFRTGNGGKVVALLTSALGPPPQPQMVSYIVGKRALQTMLECALAELGAGGLRIATISPSFTETPMLDTFHPHILETARARHPQGRFLTPERVAKSVFSCLEDETLDSQAVRHHLLTNETEIPV